MLQILTLLAALALPSDPATVVYSRQDGMELAMDVYRAPGSRGAQPAVLLYHGGSWMGGARQLMDGFARRLSKEGMVAITVSYRFAPKYKLPLIVDDAQASVRYVRANAAKLGIDPRRIAAVGHSAGGHLALLLGHTETLNPAHGENPGVSSRVAAVVSIAGPTDFTRDFPPSVGELLAPMLLGKNFSEAGPDLRMYSPASYVGRHSVPTLFVHGTADLTVPLAQSEYMHERMREVRVASQMVKVDEGGHIPDLRKPGWEDAWVECVSFLKRHLRIAIRKAA